jgi:biopolymer transport protein ExbD
MLGMSRNRGSLSEETAIEMGPMIDMTFLLLIFFIVNVNFTKETGVQVKRPDASTGTALATDSGAIITITNAGAIYFGPDRIDLGAVRPLLGKHRLQFPDGEVILVADEAVPTRLVVEVIDECRLAGVKEINLSTRGSAE